MDKSEQRADPSRDDRLAEVIEDFLAAAESGSAPSRTALLEQHPDLADDLKACLDTLDFIGNSLGNSPATSVLECGQTFGEYQILREIGRGGMGVVYEAFHLGLERRVALKVLSGRSFENEPQRERFLLEAKTAASLHHTNIVPIFEVGELDGVCYYAMQYIQGQSLGSIVRGLRSTGRVPVRSDLTIFPPGTVVRDQRDRPTAPSQQSTEVAHDSVSPNTRDSMQLSDLRVNETTPTSRTTVYSKVPVHPRTPLAEGPGSAAYFREVTRLIAQAADALSHAHRHGVVHRDIKPSNLILAGDGTVWVADFGLAFRSDDPAQKGSGDAGGTPAYMSPEQVRPGKAVVDERTDIYSLGATLYELLSLRAIFEGETSLSVLTQIASVDPVPLRKLNPLIPKDLDCIVRKATAKRSEARYGDAAEMAADLRRYLNYEPVWVRRVGPIGRLVLWCRREPRLAGVTGAATMLLLLVVVLSHWAILRARDVAVVARKTAEDQLVLTSNAEASARESFREALKQQARATRLSFQNGRRWFTLDLIQRAQSIRPDPTLRDEAIAALSIPDARFYKRLPIDSVVEILALCPHERRIAFGCRDGSIRLWEFETDQEPTVLAPAGHETDLMAFSQCGRYLAAVESDGPISLWDADSHRLVTQMELDDFRPRFLAFIAEQTCLVALNDQGRCRRWSIQHGVVEPLPVLEIGRWLSAASGPDPQSVTVATASGELEAWDLISGVRRSIDGIVLGRGRNTKMVWDPAGKILAATQRFGTLDLWNVGQQQPIRSLGPHSGSVKAVAFSPTGSLLATGGDRDLALRLWDVSTGDLIARLREPQSGSNTASFSTDGRFLAASGSDKTIWLWEIETPQSLRRLSGHENSVVRVTFAGDGKSIVSGSTDGSLLVWPTSHDSDPEPLAARSEDRESKLNPNSCVGLAVSPDNRLVAARTLSNMIQVWNLDGKELVAKLDGGRMVGGAGPRFLPDGDVLRSFGQTIQRWRVEPGSKPTTLAKASDAIVSMVASPNGERVAVCTWRNRIELFDVASGKQVGESVELPVRAMSMTISPDNKFLAVADRAGSLRLYYLAELSPFATWKVSDDELKTVVFSPNGKWIAVAGVDGLVRIRTAPGGEPVATLPGHEGGVWSLSFSPDGSSLATCGNDKLIHVWRLDSLNSELAGLGLAW